MPPDSLSCPSCRLLLDINADSAGGALRCPRCKEVCSLESFPTVAAPDAGGTALSEATPIPSVPPPVARPQEALPPLENPLRPPQQADELGRLGPYRVLEVLGRGGMGCVYQAEDTRLQRRVALKVLLPRHAGDPRARQRFLREARAAAALEHDNIVAILHVDEDNGVPYLAMPLLQGESLEDRLRREGRLPVAEVLRIGRQVAEGLAAAHERGLIHRDIKPANLWLERRHGRVKILDFGLARAVSGESDGLVTQTGEVLGTPAYMAPEQAGGEEVDARCDLFSLGCVLYRLLTGKLPFQGRGVLGFLTALATHTPEPLTTLEPAVPPALSDLVLRLLTRDRTGRPASAHAVADELAAITDSRPAEQPPVQQQPDTSPSLEPQLGSTVLLRPKNIRRRKGWLAALGLLALLVPGVWLAAVVLRTEPTKQPPIEQADAGGKERPAVGATQESEKNKVADRENTGPRPIRMAPMVKAKEPVPQPEVFDDDRTAAEWVLSVGGAVGVNGQQEEIQSPARLPQEPFRLTKVRLGFFSRLTPAGLALFEDCKNLSHLDLNGSKVSNADLAHFKGHSGLTSLDLGNTAVSEPGLAYFRGCKKLTHLNLMNSRVDDAGLAHFAPCRGLTHLYLDNTAVGDAGVAHLAGCTGLLHLGLQGTQVSDAGLASFKGCTSLTFLRLAGARVSSAGLTHFQGCRDLKSLELVAIRVTEAGLAALAGCTKLTRLSLIRLRLQDADLAAFAGCKDLTSLDLLESPVGDNGLAHFKSCKALGLLSLTGTRVSDAGLAHFKDCKQLTQLRLGKTDVGDAGLAQLEGCRRLTQLNLAGTRISDRGLALLAGFPLVELNLADTSVTAAGLLHLERCKTLVHLQLGKNRRNRDAVEKLRKALPQCLILESF